VLIAGALIGLLACADDDTDRADNALDDTTTTTMAPTTAGGADPEGPGIAEVDLTVPIVLTDLGLGLQQPIAAVAVPGSTSMLVAERGGAVHELVLEGSTGDLADGPLLELADQVGSTAGERGLLGVAVTAEGDALVVSYTAADDGSNQLDRFDLVGRPGSLSVDPDSRRSLLEVAQPFSNHNGGHVAVGPDGMLYLGIGDGGSAGDPQGNAQDPTTLLGKVLRLDPSSEDVVPPDNPFVDRPDGARPEIWLTGVRNPWRFSFDRSTGDLWIADVGQNSWEEINLLPADEDGGRGANLGWDLFEGTEPFDDPSPAPGGWSDGPFVDPVHTYELNGGCAVTGGIVYRGESIPALAGAYLFGDYCGDGVRGLVLRDDGAEVGELESDRVAQIVSFAETDAGEVLVISLSDGVYALGPA
jgi:glucose/arabinose dehydrogenase